MAKSTSRPPRKPTPISLNTPFDEPPNDTGAAEPQETELSAAEPEESAPDSPPAPRTNSKTPTFKEKMNRVPAKDWGARANIYLYRIEPIIDRTRSGGKKFINVYSEPVSEDRIMADYGSGHYKLILNFRKPGAATGDEIDSDYWELLNMKYPPKIPLGEWTDDPRNKKWAWAKEANGIPVQPLPQQNTPVETFVDVLRATNEMRREMREEVQTVTPQAPPAPADPFDTAKKIMEMRANDPMVAALMQRLEAMDRAQEAARMREFELQKELRQQAAAPAAQSKSFLEQLTEFASISEKLDPLKKLFGLATNGTEAVVRAGRTTWLDVSRELGSKFLESDLATGVGQYLGALAMKNVNGAPQPMNGTPGTQVQPQTEEAQFNLFIRETLNPALRRFYLQGFDGGDFASWLNDAFPERLKQLQNFTHPMAPGMRGAPVIIGAYKRTPEMWPILKDARPNGEEAFTQFVNEFCQWQPETQEPIDAEIVPDSEEAPERIS